MHAYELMKNVLDMYSKDKKLNRKIKVHFSKCNNYKELIEKYKNNENIIEGILSMFNYFKPFLKNHLLSGDTFNYFNLNTNINELKEKSNDFKLFLK